MSLQGSGVALPTVTSDELIDRYEAILVDAYGVLVDGAGARPGAPQFIERLERSGRPWLVVTNDASRSAETSAAHYQAFGLPIQADRVLTAGHLLVEDFARHNLRGCSVLVLGRPDSHRYVAEAGGVPVEPEAPEALNCAAIVAADAAGFDFLPGMNRAISLAFKCFDQGRPLDLIAPNPDLVFPAGDDRFGVAAGTMAAMIEGALHLRHPANEAIRFRRLGKPYPGIFHAALARVGTPRAVMIGDQMATDIAGARGAGLDAVLVRHGVGGAPISPELAPTHYLSHL